jgi:hypothetical protein
MAALQKADATESPSPHFPKRAGISSQGNSRSMASECTSWTLPLGGKRTAVANLWCEPLFNRDFRTQFLFYLKSLADHGILQGPRNYCSFCHGTVAIHLHFSLALEPGKVFRMLRRTILSPAGE